MRSSIRVILFGAFTALVLLVAGLMLAVSWVQQQRAEQQLAASILGGMQQRVTTELQRLFSPIEAQLAIDLERVRIGQLVRHETRALKDQLLPSMRRLPGVESMMVGDETGYQLLLMRWSAAAAASPLLRGVAGVPPVQPAREQFFTRDFRPAQWGARSEWTLWDGVDGTAVAQWSVDLPGYDPTSRPWHEAAMRRLRAAAAAPAVAAAPALAWTGIDLLFTTKTPGMSASAAARSPDGSVMIVAYDLLLDDLGRFMAGLRPTPGGSAFLCAADGTVVAAPHSGAGAQPARPAGAMPKLDELGAPFAAWWSRTRARRDGEPVFAYEVDGARWHGVSARFDLEGAPLWVGVVVPCSDLGEIVGHHVSTYAALVSGCVVIGLLLAHWFSGRFARPLQQVVAASRRIGELHLDAAPAPRSRIAELADLVAALEAMRAALSGHIAAREHAVRALAAGEELFRTTFELAAVGIVRAAVDGRIELVNDQFCNLLGRTREELLTMRLADVTHPDEVEPDRERAARLACSTPSRQTSQWETRYCHRDGRVVPVQVALRVLRDAKGRATHFLGIVQDISERVTLEVQLHQSQRLESVGRLAGGVAHDFNNLLTAMLGHVTLAAQMLPAEHAARAELAAVERAVASAASLIRQLLTFARQDHPDRRLIDAGAGVLESEPLLRRLAGGRVELAITVANGPHPVFMDPTQLQQVVVNLVANARDAMPDGGRVTIAVDRHAGAGPDPGVASVLLTVADTGLGMSDEVRARAFDPFFTTKAPGKGTGLGLATCHGIVERAGGTIRLRSSPGQGTTVEVRLPCSHETAAPEPAGPAPGAGGPETILVVEDEPSIRRVVQHVLTGEGYRVIAAEGAEQALAAMAGGERIDLLLTDVVMPGMHGGELVARLRADQPCLRVLFTSGHAGEVLEDRIPPESSLLSKPYTPGDLLRRVREMLDGPSVPPGGRA